MRSLALTVLLAASLVSCTRVETSTCGAYVSPQQCSQARASFSVWVSQSCHAGTLKESVVKNLKASNPNLIPSAHAICQNSFAGKSSDDLFYNMFANYKCTRIEQGGLDRGPVREFLGRTIAANTEIEGLTADMKEALRSQCNEFRNGRISSRDLLYNEARVWRMYQREGTSAVLHGAWESLTWPFRAIIALLGVVGMVLGVISGFKKLTNKG